MDIVDRDYTDRKMKAQLKSADRLHASYCLIIGEDELEKGIAQVKDMKTGNQKEVELTNFVDISKTVVCLRRKRHVWKNILLRRSF